MRNYADAKIYKLIDTDGYYYIGHTCNALSKRFNEHKSSSKRNNGRRVYQHLNGVGWDNVRIVLICDNLNVENNEQLLREEDSHIQMNRDDPLCLNSISAVLNIERMKETKRCFNQRRYAEHSEELIAISKKWREENLERHKGSVAAHYQRNKDHLGEKVRCPTCGSLSRRSWLREHQKTYKCQAYSV